MSRTNARCAWCASASRPGTIRSRPCATRLEIGARVLDREQAAANSEYVKTEFERASRELEAQFTDRARTVAEHFGKKVDEVFGPESGRLAKDLEKHFGDGSSASVQNRVRELVGEALTRSRRTWCASSRPPTAPTRSPTSRRGRSTPSTRRPAARTPRSARLMAKLAELQKELQSLRDEKDKLEEVHAERERGTAKGRSFEELVSDSVDALALPQGDVAEAVGDQPGAAGKTGDVVVSVGACDGPARGRIVFEAKDRRLSKPAALAELDRALAARDADFAVLVVPSEDELPARLQPLREYNGDKLLVVMDPDDDTGLALEIAYRLARARVLMARGGEGVDGAAVHDLVERAVASMEDVRKVKSQLTGAKTGIDTAYKIVEEIAARVRGHLAEVDALVLAGVTEDEECEAVPSAVAEAISPSEAEPEPIRSIS